MLGQEGLNIPISKPIFCKTGTIGVSQKKKLHAITFARQYRISHCKSPSIGLFILDIYYVFISIMQKFASFTSFNSMYNSSYCISVPCRSRVHIDRGLKANHSFAFSSTFWKKKVTFTGRSITFGASMFDEPQPRPLFYGIKANI